MEQAGFIVGIDLGTSKITGVLGRKNEQGVISILASESVPSDSCVKYGVIYNIDEAAGKIKKLISMLENKTGKKIGKAYVSIAGKSLRAVEHTETKMLDGVTPITFAVLDNMEQQAKLNKPDFFTNYSVLAPEYFLDGKYQDDPIDKVASSIEGHYRLVIGRPNIKTNLTKSITDKAGIEIAGYIVGPVAAGALVLDEHDRQAGCALVDFGAGTTTLSVYKGGLLRYMSVVPFGGRTITKDVQELGFVFDSAETYKVRYGKLGKDKNKPANDLAPEVDLRELNKVIQLRQDEIILNVINQIKESDYGDQLDAGIIIMGAASQMNGLVDHLAEKSQMSVKRAIAKRVYINNAAELLQNPAYTQALSLLLFANENCEKKEVAEPVVQEQPVYTPPVTTRADEPEDDDEPETKKQKKQKKQKDSKQTTLFGFFEKIQNFGGTMFNDEE
ncbi:cell division protein FtsA [Dysgonomonas sp. PFB1-18]|uniref:cell division protein FtsA n=1 Tax=unclassified Dysgonomonas TaxID=2630389 RepID=UPI002475AF07|nr:MULTISPECIES: cell division protein FtsA [unclassified Dysgonomonas]MDH6307460.1 cell division protein FtsA [Dysgonomonas sp. PF1-14]MDH6337378.1 cell division protein FtsA [Dysgonomonas sp. PF1-16]MDH6379302.1 cell division protein FtsA [Dysgonomonas sp. PFB1-18]MDH6396060.1 cell division protein FtsA [Dysgonomonas sp. PF1-23]